MQTSNHERKEVDETYLLSWLQPFSQLIARKTVSNADEVQSLIWIMRVLI